MMTTPKSLVTAVLAAIAGAVIVSKSLAFPSAVVLAFLTAWAIGRFLQWRNGLRLRLAQPQTVASERRRGSRRVC
jgi:hypothetical protein